MDKNYDIAIEELYIPSKHDKDTYLCEDFVIYPEGKEKNGGYLMGIVEVRATPTDESEKIVQTLINTLKNNYYDQINSSPEPQKLNLETVFEYALQKTNAALVELIQIGHINLVLENLNYIIAVAKPNKGKNIDFIFAQQGLINAYLLHKTKQNNYKVINILDNTPKLKEEQSDKLKIFSSTLAGSIYHNDALYLSSEIFSNYIPAHKVNKILSTNDLPTAIDYFKSLINNVKNNSYLTYCAIFLKLSEKRNLSEEPVSQQSINNLISTKENTEKFLTPTFALNIWDQFRRITKLFKRKPNKKLHSPHKNEKMKFGVVKYVANIFKIFFGYIISIGHKIKNFAAGKGKSEKEKPKLGEIPKTKISRSKDRLFSLNKYSKYILAVLVILVIAFVSSIFWMKHHKQVKADQEAYAAQIQTAKNHINNAQVNLIYKDEAKSLDFVKKANEIIEYLPQATSIQQANFQELQKQADNIINQLLHVTKVTPQLVNGFTNEGQPTNLTSIELANNTILASTIDNLLFSANIEDQTIGGPYKSKQGDFRHSLQEDDKVMFVTNQNKLLNFKDNKLTPISITWGDNTQIIDLGLYNNNIYAVDASQGQILKWRPATDTYGSSQSWIKEKAAADLTKATSLTIDGNIYVSTSDSKVYRFFTGNLEEFKLQAIEPELSGIEKIYTNADINKIYLLEQNSKRIITVNKEGAMQAQYLFETLDNNISDFLIKDNKIFLISNNKLYQANL
jgi:hypothetical protein